MAPADRRPMVLDFGGNDAVFEKPPTNRNQYYTHIRIPTTSLHRALISNSNFKCLVSRI